MKMPQSVAFILGFAACCVAGWAAPSTDVVAVRAAYAKIVIAWQLGQIENSVDASPASLPTQLNITLEDIRNGPLTDVLSVPLRDLVTIPSGVSLSIGGPGTWSFTTEKGVQLTTEMTALVGWGKTDYSLQADWSAPLSRLAEQIGADSHLSRYVTYQVQVSYGQRKAQYKAMFLFGGNDLGPQGVRVIDMFSQPPEALIRTPLGMEPLSVAPFRSRPNVRSFLESLRPPEGCSIERLTGLCCDPTGEHCGITNDALHVNTLAVP
jgi:hypothetical protein